MSAKPTLDLTGKILIAMPSMPDERFAHSVVFICEHSEDGAMGLIVNKFLAKMPLSEIVEETVKVEGAEKLPVHYGGPVERQRGFVLHSSDYRNGASTMSVTDAFSMTVTTDVLHKIQASKGPKYALLALGYSGWGAGQLEEELQMNGWLVADPTPELLFISKDEDKWHKALDLIGVDPKSLSSQIGRA